MMEIVSEVQEFTATSSSSQASADEVGVFSQSKGSISQVDELANRLETVNIRRDSQVLSLQCMEMVTLLLERTKSVCTFLGTS